MDGNVARIVRGIKQQWMGNDQRDWRTEATVKCRVEDLRERERRHGWGVKQSPTAKFSYSIPELYYVVPLN